jgi:signal peptidase I
MKNSFLLLLFLNFKRFGGDMNTKNNIEEKKSFNLKAEIKSWLSIIIIAALIAFFLNNFIIANSKVPSASMENTIMTGNRLIGFRLSYLFENPKRGDIIIFKFPDNEKKYYVKRIIGISGDIVDIKGGKVYLNNSTTPLDEPYIKEPMIVQNDMHFEVPEDAYFCLGDNRNSSIDARYWNNTYVYKNKIISKVIFRYFPSFGLVK